MRAFFAAMFVLAGVPAFAGAPPADAPVAAIQRLKLTGPLTDAPKFVGTWAGRTECPKLGTWKFTITLQPSGKSYAAKAETEGSGVFREMAFKQDMLTLVYSTVWKDASYIGRLVSPERIEGHVKIQEDCTWYLAKQA